MEGCPVQHDHPVKKSKIEGCPVHENKDGYNAPANDMAFNHLPAEGQTKPLGVERSVSNIPKGSFTPKHQPESGDKWVYPSEQQYYNAMKRKGHNPNIDDVPHILNIHNAVNEQGWMKVREWEAMRGNHNPRLIRFMGRPKDQTPKAWFRQLFGSVKPFDRHDWTIDRNGEEVRYVIDFYRGYGNEIKNGRANIFLDVRPGLDSFTAVVDTIAFSMRRWFNPTSLPKNSLLSHPTFSNLARNAKN